MNYYYQRNPKWKDKKLGFSNYTIEFYGCTICGLSSLAGVEPDIFNDKLKAVKGFQGALVIWSKIKEAFPNLEFEWRGYSYENEKVSQAIKDYGACLVEVDASRIGVETHWCLYIGSQKMYDSWFDTIKATSYYKPKGYAIIKRKETMSDMYKGLDLTNKESMKVAVDVWADQRDGKLVKKEELINLKEMHKADLDQLNTRIQEEKDRYKNFIKKVSDKFQSSQQEPEMLEAMTEVINQAGRVPKLEKEILALKEVLAGEKKEVIIKTTDHTHPEWAYKMGIAVKGA